MPVKLSNGITEHNYNQTYIHRGKVIGIQTGCLGALYGEQSLAVLNRSGVLVFKDENYLE